MSKLWIVVMALAGLLLLPSDGNTQTDQGATTGTPPVAQALVREGDFAVRLVEALGLGSQQDEEGAEAVLSSAQIAPGMGWVSDFPVTPEVMGDLQRTVAAAADTRRLPMEKDEALKNMRAASAELGIPVAVDTDPADASTANIGPEQGYGGNEDSAWVDRYYEDYGAPVITYYPPPEDYYDQYVWVPYPFWYSGYYFTGFYCLHDFNRVVVFRHARKFVTNHRIDRRTGRVFLIDPADSFRRRHPHAWARSAGSAAALRGSSTGTIGARSIRRGSGPAETTTVSPARSGSAGGWVQTQAPSERGRTVRPSPLRGSFSRPALPESSPVVQPRDGGRENFRRDESFDRSHGSGHSGFSQQPRGGGSGRGFIFRGSGRSAPACRVNC
jgi:hypothetical protein